jgi:RecA/RadA recombinase
MKQKIGCIAIDKLLDGGWLRKAVNLIYGKIDSVKTAFSTLTSIQAMKENKSVFYLNTETGFSVKRFEQLCLENGEIHSLDGYYMKLIKETEEVFKE